MKRFSMLLAAGFAALAVFAGCITNAPLTPTQVAAIVCLPTQTAMSSFQTVLATLPATDATAQKVSADITKAEPAIATLCTAGATISTASVQSFAQTALPAMSDIAASLPLDVKMQQQAQAAIAAAEVATAFGAALATSAQSATAAPVSASTPLAGAPLQ